MAQRWGQFRPRAGLPLAQARARYAQFVHDGYNQASIWAKLQQQIYLGDARFVAQMQSRMTVGDRLDEVPIMAWAV